MFHSTMERWYYNMEIFKLNNICCCNLPCIVANIQDQVNNEKAGNCIASGGEFNNKTIFSVLDTEGD